MTVRGAVTVVFLCGVLVVWTGVGAAQMKPGLWEMTISSEAQGVKMPAVTQRQCISDERYVPKGQETDDESCRMTEHHTSGDTTTWKVECTIEGKRSVSSGKMIVHGDSLEGTIEITHDGMKMVQQMRGKRLGDCPKK